MLEARAELVKLQQGDAGERRAVAEVHRRLDDRVQPRLRAARRQLRRHARRELLQRSAAGDGAAAASTRASPSRAGRARRLLQEARRHATRCRRRIVRKVRRRLQLRHHRRGRRALPRRALAPARIIILTDERQQLHFRQVFAIARRLGVTCSLEHVWFGLMRLPEGTISTRDGKLIQLEALLDEAETRALAAGNRGEPRASATTELAEIARVVGIGAVKYNDLSKDRQTLRDLHLGQGAVAHGEQRARTCSTPMRAFSRSCARRPTKARRRARWRRWRRRSGRCSRKLYDFGAAVEAVAATDAPASAVRLSVRSRRARSRRSTANSPCSRPSRACAPRDCRLCR